MIKSGKPTVNGAKNGHPGACGGHIVDVIWNNQFCERSCHFLLYSRCWDLNVILFIHKMRPHYTLFLFFFNSLSPTSMCVSPQDHWTSLSGNPILRACSSTTSTAHNATLMWSAAVGLPGFPWVLLRACDSWDKAAKQTETVKGSSFCIAGPLACSTALSLSRVSWLSQRQEVNTDWFEERMRGCEYLLPSAAADSAVWESNCHPSDLANS